MRDNVNTSFACAYGNYKPVYISTVDIINGMRRRRMRRAPMDKPSVTQIN